MFLLVPAHPGCPGQIPQSRKTVVCVCVCICLGLLCVFVVVTVGFVFVFSELAMRLTVKSVTNNKLFCVEWNVQHYLSQFKFNLCGTFCLQCFHTVGLQSLFSHPVASVTEQIIY